MLQDEPLMTSTDCLNPPNEAFAPLTVNVNFTLWMGLVANEQKENISNETEETLENFIQNPPKKNRCTSARMINSEYLKSGWDNGQFVRAHLDEILKWDKVSIND